MDDAVIRDFEQGAERVEQEVRGVPEHVMSVEPGPDQWSINEILVHLSDAELVGAERLRRVLCEDAPELRNYDESAWGDRLHYAARDPRAALDLFRSLRRSNAELVKKLSEADWKRTGVHSERGPMTVAELVKVYTSHVDYHVNQIEAIKTANGIQGKGSH